MSHRNPSLERGELHRLAEQHGGMVYRLALRIVRNRTDAEDVAQEVFVKLVEARRRASVDEPRGWLAITALNTARNWVRRESNHRRRSEVWAERRALDGNGALEEDGSVTTDDREEAVWRAVDALPSDLRFPLLLHYQEGLKYREIATALACPPGTVATRISEARARVRTLIQRNGALKP